MRTPLDEMTSLHGIFCKYLSKKAMDFLKNRAIITKTNTTVSLFERERGRQGDSIPWLTADYRKAESI